MGVTRKTTGDSSHDKTSETPRGKSRDGGKDEAPKIPPNSASRGRLVIKDQSDTDLPAPRPATPVRRSRRLSGDHDTPLVQTIPTTRRTRLSTGDKSAQVPTETLEKKRSITSANSGNKPKPASRAQVKPTGTQSAESQSTPMKEHRTPFKRTRRASIDSQDTDLPTPTRRSRRVSSGDAGQDILTDGLDISTLRTPTGRSRRRSGDGIPELSNEASDVALLRVDKKPVCEVKELKGLLHVIEESDEQMDIDSTSQAPKSGVEETHTIKSRSDTLSVIDEVEELLDIDGNSDLSKSFNKANEEKEAILESKILSSVDVTVMDHSATVLGDKLKKNYEKVTKKVLPTLDVTSEEISIREKVQNHNKSDEEEIDVVGIDDKIIEDSCSLSATTNNKRYTSVVGDETVSTTVVTEDDVLRSSTTPLKPINSEEMSSKDREVSSTTNITAAVKNTNDQPAKPKIHDKKKQINNNTKMSDENLELAKRLSNLRNIPRGLPVSGRWWKQEKERFRSINKDTTGKKSWAKKMKIKQDRQNVMARSSALEAEKQRKKDELKERRRLNKIRTEENAKKSEIVQVIKNPMKIKKMKRKQLRYIQTRDTTDLVQKQRS